MTLIPRLLIALVFPGTLAAENLTFPTGDAQRDAKVHDVTLESLTIGGVTTPPANGRDTLDDTAAFKAIWSKYHGNRNSWEVIYIPNGTYYISDTIFYNYTEPEGRVYFQGQSEAGVKLVLRPSDQSFDDPAKPKPMFRNGGDNWLLVSQNPANANFQNYYCNFTIDTGNHPGAIGFSFMSHNCGGMNHVTIKGKGTIGLDMRHPAPGPSYLRNLTIDGFEHGIDIATSQYISVFEHITLRNQSRAGLRNTGHPTTIRNLHSINRVPAIHLPISTTFTRWDTGVSRDRPGGSSHLVLIDSVLETPAGTTASTAAIQKDAPPSSTAQPALLLRNVRSRGYAAVVSNISAALGNPVTEYAYPAFQAAAPGVQPSRSLGLPVRNTPAAPEFPHSDWVSVKTYAHLVVDGDWAPAIQAAMNAGKPVVYFPHGLYIIKSPFTVGGAVQLIEGMGSQLYTVKGYAHDRVMEVRSGSAPRLWIHQLRLDTDVSERGKDLAFGFLLDNSKRSLVVIDSLISDYHSGPDCGEVFMDDCIGYYTFNYPQNAWLRSVNTEDNGGRGYHGPKIVNKAANLWILGIKTEGPSTVIQTGASGTPTGTLAKTEVLGGFIYPVAGPSLNNAIKTQPAFDVQNGGMLSMNLRFYNSNANMLRETRASNVYLIPKISTGNEAFSFASHALAGTTSAVDVMRSEVPLVMPDAQASARLLEWRKLGYGMFLHFGMSTFTGVELDLGDKPSTTYAPKEVDVDQWIRVAKEAGMKYAVLTSKHVSGHCLWDSKVQFRGKEYDYDVATSGNKTDVIRAFVDACGKHQIMPGLYYCLLDYHNNSVPRDRQWENYNLPDDFLQLAKDQIRELCARYPEVRYYWLDIPRAASADQRAELYSLARTLNPKAVVMFNYGLLDPKKLGDLTVENTKGISWPTDILNSERDVILKPFATTQTWNGKSHFLGYEHCDVIGKEWFWTAEDKARSNEKLFELYDSTRKAGGNFLLDVGPGRDGKLQGWQITALTKLKASIEATTTKPYEATWESLDRHPMPAWYDDAKIGLSMHWGVYSVPAWAPRDKGISYAEWYGQRMHESGNPTSSYHSKNYGDKFTYDDFIPQWKAENYQPADWAKFAKKMGAKYIFITSKHHDGFCLWPTQYTDRNSLKMGPKIDILGPYFEAARKEGLKVGLYYSLYEWHNPLYTGKDIPYAGLKKVNRYVDDFMAPQIKELIDLYHPDFFFFDGEWDHPESFWKMKDVTAYYYNEAAKRNQEVFVNDRFGKGDRGKHGDLYNVEYEADKSSEGLLTHKWSYWQGIAKTFGYNRDTDLEDCLSPKQFIDKVVNGVAHNGNFDINVGPTASGEIPSYEQHPLLQLGSWLEVNGEAIYGSRPWRVQREGDARFTAKGDVLYAIFLKWQGEAFRLKSVKPAPGSKITMLGAPGDLDWSWSEADGLLIKFPRDQARPTSCSYAWTFKISLK